MKKDNLIEMFKRAKEENKKIYWREYTDGG